MSVRQSGYSILSCMACLCLVSHHWSRLARVQFRSSICFNALNIPSSYDQYDETWFTVSIRKHALIWCSITVTTNHNAAATCSRRCTDPSLTAFSLLGIQSAIQKVVIRHESQWEWLLLVLSVCKPYGSMNPARPTNHLVVNGVALCW